MKNLKMSSFLIRGYRPAACGLQRTAAGCFLFLFIFSIISLAGCAAIRETAKSISGTSTKDLEAGRKEAITGVFSYDYNTCFSKSLETLRRLGTYIYAKDKKKQMIAAYLSASDTTSVGIFFENKGASDTRVEVSSPSTYAKELIAEKLFSDLESSHTLEKMEADINAKKEMGDK